jgi:hypothetical protein
MNLSAPQSEPNDPANRRQAERVGLPAGYTPVALRTLDLDRHVLEGHAYDLSVGGVMFELDKGIAPGTPVSVRIDLPRSVLDTGPGRSVFVFGNVVWLDDSEPGPVRMAVAFSRFARAGDEFRIHRVIANAAVRRAA